jgi:hypothetical protein
MSNEAAIQAAVAGFLDVALRPPARWWHTPNGSLRNKAVAAKLKAAGVKPGVPDIMMFWPGHNAAIELKSPDGVLDIAQHAFAEQWIRAGNLYAIAQGVDDVETALRFWGAPLRATQLRTGTPLIAAEPKDLPEPGHIVFTRARRLALAARLA